MKRPVLLLTVGLLACTTDVIGPTGLYPGYSLVSIDGQLLPVADDETPSGAVIIAASLVFPRAGRPRGTENSLVSYTRWFRTANQPIERLTLELDFAVDDGEVRINLCPPLALCIVPTELIGQVDARELELTHVLAGQPRAVYRYTAALPE
jgi:hypothetical protein